MKLSTPHLLGIKDLQSQDIRLILDTAQQFKEVLQRPIKKVLEARYRKKKKLEKQMRKFKRAADQVFEEEGMDDRTKGKEVQKLRHKIVTADKNKNAKKIIVENKFTLVAPGKKTAGKKYMIVDRHLKKEFRAEKRRKRNGKSGGKKSKRY